MATYRRGEPVEVQIKDFAPDKDLDSPGTLLDIQGAIPTFKGFQCLNQALPHIYGPLPSKAIGSTIGLYDGITPQFWAGTTNHLYRAFGTLDDPSSLWVQADRMGALSFNAAQWRFAQFNDDLIAVGGASVPPQVAVGPTGIFDVLGGGPPTGASVVVAVNSQVMMFSGNSWFVSAIGTDNNWTPSTQTQAGFAQITDFPGPVVAAQPLFRNVVAFKNLGIWLMNYVGGFQIWSVQLVSDINGTWSQESTMLTPEGIAFLGLDDFYITTGYTPQRIPNSLKEWFFDTASAQYFPFITSRYEPYNAIGYWHFVSKTAPNPPICDRFVAYNFRAGRWGSGYLQTPCVPTPNFHFLFPAQINGFYFDQNNVLQTFRGTPGTMRVLTSYMGKSGKLSQLLRVRPKFDFYPVTETMRAFHVNSLGGQDVAGPVAMLGQDGWFYLRQTDRFHRVQLETVGGTTAQLGAEVNTGAEVTGFSFEYREAGDR